MLVFVFFCFFFTQHECFLCSAIMCFFFSFFLSLPLCCVRKKTRQVSYRARPCPSAGLPCGAPRRFRCRSRRSPSRNPSPTISSATATTTASTTTTLSTTATRTSSKWRGRRRRSQAQQRVRCAGPFGRGFSYPIPPCSFR